MQADVSSPGRDLLKKLSDEVERFIASNQPLVESSNADNINLGMFQAREKLISNLTSFSSMIGSLKMRVDEATQHAKNIRGRELAAMDALLKGTHVAQVTMGQPQTQAYAAGAAGAAVVSVIPRGSIVPANAFVPRGTAQVQTPPPVNGGSSAKKVLQVAPVISTSAAPVAKKHAGVNGNSSQPQPAHATTDEDPAPKTTKPHASDWQVVVRKKTQETPAKKPSSQPSLAEQIPIEYSKISLTNALFIKAVRVNSFDAVRQDGNLYYVEYADHFAFRIGGMLFHGNIGIIYTNEENPQKIRNCKFGNMCAKRDDCNYYHDPESFLGSKDRRNYIASSLLYAPSDSQYKRARGRKFGSLDYLDKDVGAMNEEDLARTYDAAMHDILCAILLRTVYSGSK